MVISALNPDLDSVSTADVIVISYIMLATQDNGDTEIIFNAHPALVKKIEKLFAIELRDELSFFTPSGKAGELNEIPVSAVDSPVEKIILLGVGDQSLASFRTSWRGTWSQGAREQRRTLQLSLLQSAMKLSPLLPRQL